MFHLINRFLNCSHSLCSPNQFPASFPPKSMNLMMFSSATPDKRKFLLFRHNSPLQSLYRLPLILIYLMKNNNHLYNSMPVQFHSHSLKQTPYFRLKPKALRTPSQTPISFSSKKNTPFLYAISTLNSFSLIRLSITKQGV